VHKASLTSPHKIAILFVQLFHPQELVAPLDDPEEMIELGDSGQLGAGKVPRDVEEGTIDSNAGEQRAKEGAETDRSAVKRRANLEIMKRELYQEDNDGGGDNGTEN
jgi:hypothetical protein